jgi:hypothetical protein
MTTNYKATVTAKNTKTGEVTVKTFTNKDEAYTYMAKQINAITYLEETGLKL